MFTGSSLGTFASLAAMSNWDWIHDRPTVVTEIPPGSKGVHESLLRSYQVLTHVKQMLSRGDSVVSVVEFIEWAERPDD